MACVKGLHTRTAALKFRSFSFLFFFVRIESRFTLNAFVFFSLYSLKRSIDALVKILSDFAVSTLAYFFIGYGIAYGVHFFSGAGALVERKRSTNPILT